MRLTSCFLLAGLAVGVVGVPGPLLGKRTSCTTPDGSGTCQSTSSCGTFSVSGYCPGSSSEQCCVSESCTVSQGSGTCKDNSKSCDGGYYSGACKGPSSVQCCVSNASCSTPQGKGTCKSTSSCNGWSLSGYCPGSGSNQCCINTDCTTTKGDGTCKNTANGCSGGSFVSGNCPGGSDVQCCVPTNSATCTTPSGKGKCQSTSSCSGFSLGGYCQGSADTQCCLAPTKCTTSQGSGTCKNTSNGCSNGKFLGGACPGSSTVKCCVPGATTPPDPPPGSNIPTLDISSGQSSSFFSCAASKWKKLVIRGYEQACSSGGIVDPNLKTAASAAKSAGFDNIEAYLFPCTGSGCKSVSTQLSEFESAVGAAGLNPVHLWLDIEPTTSPCAGWQLGTSGNLALAKQWVSAIKGSTKYKWGIYANGGQWSGMFGSQHTSIGASDLPLWAVQDDMEPGVGTVTTFPGDWTTAYAKQYSLDTTVCGAGVDESSFSG